MLNAHTPLCRGCNLLQRLSLDCCKLSSMDATFCTQLDSLTLSKALAGAPLLQSLVLSVCSALEPAMPARVTLSCLRLLDLSYTNIQVRLLVKGESTGGSRPHFRTSAQCAAQHYIEHCSCQQHLMLRTHSCWRRGWSCVGRQQETQSQPQSLLLKMPQSSTLFFLTANFSAPKICLQLSSSLDSRH